MKDEEERSNEYHLDPDSPEIADEIIAQERTDYIRRSQARVSALLALVAMMILLIFQSPKARAGGPKCDRKDSEKCGMVSCAGMKDKMSNCNNRCHKGCCYCPDGRDPLEGSACPRDDYRGNPDEGEPQR